MKITGQNFPYLAKTLNNKDMDDVGTVGGVKWQAGLEKWKAAMQAGCPKAKKRQAEAGDETEVAEEDGAGGVVVASMEKKGLSAASRARKRVSVHLLGGRGSGGSDAGCRQECRIPAPEPVGWRADEDGTRGSPETMESSPSAQAPREQITSGRDTDGPSRAAGTCALLSSCKPVMSLAERRRQLQEQTAYSCHNWP